MKLVIMTKAKKLAEGTIRTHGGKKVKKVGGKWLSVKGEEKEKAKEFSGVTDEGKQVKLGQEPNGMYYGEIRDKSGSVESAMTGKTASDVKKWFAEQGIKSIGKVQKKKEKKAAPAKKEKKDLKYYEKKLGKDELEGRILDAVMTSDAFEDKFDKDTEAVQDIFDDMSYKEIGELLKEYDYDMMEHVTHGVK